MSPRGPGELLARAAQGDREAFVALYRALHPTVAGFVARRVRSAADAEDVVAKTFERMVAQLDRYDPKRGSPEAWVLVMARSIIIDHQRRASKVVSIANAEAATYQPLDPVLKGERSRALREAIEQHCSDSDRELLTLRYGDGLSHREIASILDVSDAAVRKRLSRVIARLRDRLENENGAESEVGYAAQ